jgi:hypothetical protein
MSNNPFPKPDAETIGRIDRILKDCRRQIAEKGEVLPVALIMHGDDEIEIVPMLFSNLAEKERVAFGIRELTGIYEAHTVMLIHEVWTLPEGVTKDVADSLLAKYGQIANMPQRVEMVRVAIEERAGGIWEAHARIVRNGRGVKLAEPVYRDFSEGVMSGRFGGWFAPERPAPNFGSGPSSGEET